MKVLKWIITVLALAAVFAVIGWYLVIPIQMILEAW